MAFSWDQLGCLARDLYNELSSIHGQPWEEAVPSVREKYRAWAERFLMAVNKEAHEAAVRQVVTEMIRENYKPIIDEMVEQALARRLAAMGIEVSS